jgi:hypothetical protein
MKMQSNLYIKGTQGKPKMCPLLAVALYIQFKLYALFSNRKNETEICFIEVPFIDSDLLYGGALYRQ